MRISFQSKVLQRIAVVDRVRVVVLGHLDDLLIVFCVVIDVPFTDGRHVVHSVEKIGCEIGVGWPFCYIVSKCADL